MSHREGKGFTGRRHTLDSIEKMGCANTGKKHSEAAKKKMSISRTRIKFTVEHKVKLSEANKGKHQHPGVKGDKNVSWKGDAISNRNLHRWLRRQIEEPKTCSLCKKDKKLELCNVDHKYRRAVEDYFYACRSCHRLYDNKRKRGLSFA